MILQKNDHDFTKKMIMIMILQKNDHDHDFTKKMIMIMILQKKLIMILQKK